MLLQVLWHMQREYEHTKAWGKFAEGKVSIAVRIKGVEHVLQLLRTER